MPLIKEGRLIADPWRAIGADEALPERGPILLPLERFLAEEAALAGRGPLGIALANDQKPETLAGRLDGVALVALHFPKFNDGRAYSQARILRERLGYGGELRARGRVLRDQLLFMLRCGFDSFELAAGETAESFAEAMREYSRFYQPAADSRPAGLRRWG
ncbi:MAG: DUF934 domain-containing protein [Alphaproteobacteria bacterium]|nr:DUF934 domain-containing protein [Alphaproteobacteria bacterium]